MTTNKEQLQPADAGRVDRPVGRHCWNPWCDGPEWWALFDDAQDEYRACPSCGYPCSVERMPEAAMTAAAICEALLVTPNVRSNAQATAAQEHADEQE